MEWLLFAYGAIGAWLSVMYWRSANRTKVTAKATLTSLLLGFLWLPMVIVYIVFNRQIMIWIKNMEKRQKAQGTSVPANVIDGFPEYELVEITSKLSFIVSDGDILGCVYRHTDTDKKWRGADTSRIVPPRDSAESAAKMLLAKQMMEGVDVRH